MILMRANPLQGPSEGVGPENHDIFEPWNGNNRKECPKKSRDFQGPPLPMAYVMDLPLSKSLTSSAI